MSEVAGARPWPEEVGEFLFIAGTNTRIEGSYWWQARARGCWLRLAVGGECDANTAWGSGGGKIARRGSRCFGSTGCQAAIASHIHVFSNMRGGVGEVVFVRWASVGSRRRDWSSPSFPIESLMVITIVRAVVWEGWAAPGDSLRVASLGSGGVLASVSRARIMKCTLRRGGVSLRVLG